MDHEVASQGGAGSAMAVEAVSTPRARSNRWRGSSQKACFLEGHILLGVPLSKKLKEGHRAQFAYCATEQRLLSASSCRSTPLPPPICIPHSECTTSKWCKVAVLTHPSVRSTCSFWRSLCRRFVGPPAGRFRSCTPSHAEVCGWRSDQQRGFCQRLRRARHDLQAWRRLRRAQTEAVLHQRPRVPGDLDLADFPER